MNKKVSHQDSSGALFANLLWDFRAIFSGWRSLGDSNPCFRRERAIDVSLGVHARLRKCNKHR
jgi:hypothetical protein